ncbi:MAG: gmk [Parcubacteria group bacterium]|nr:gmk [Parcubacteria group bacterium]
MTYPGKLVLVVGAAGSGKGVLIKRAKEQHSEILFPITATTRAIRPGETEGNPYHFLTGEEFDARIEANDFIEWASIDGGKRYGTLKADVIPALTEGKLLLKEMEVQGVGQMRATLPKENIVTVYIDAGSWESLARRIKGRAPISDEELESRRLRYEYERAFKDEADHIVENFDGKFKEADASFEKIISSLLPSA